MIKNFNNISEEVFYPNLEDYFLSKDHLQDLLNYAETCKRKRARICGHQKAESLVHEMFIVHPQYAYVRPHKHIGKTESMLVLEGEVDFIIFDEQGGISEKISMGDFHSGMCFYHCMSEPKFHSLLIKSKKLIFLEITNGPFIASQTEFADWSPLESEEQKVIEFIENLKKYKV